MRTVLLVGALLLVPGAASAACQCVCAAGKSRAACSLPTDVEPICMQICPEKIGSDSVAASPISSGLGGGLGGSLASGAAAAQASGLARAMSQGLPGGLSGAGDPRLLER
ncbi:hypothetical protein [Methylobacterium organophilum]|uniref:Uncharacterized protein n=1 Tax=Methylobacterium organophilum TaxID=410 RepID=A0ABQ4TE14_METOR|nr:hypothetical protein [Methylobacterium organophilum]UMY15810.1 hypothetical protein MMB17_13785 [Methylobacterium organophilum]GJE28577.1 hypothetical protein LKMONMHP_3449 [Methylobacterium organophilum]